MSKSKSQLCNVEMTDLTLVFNDIADCDYQDTLPFLEETNPSPSCHRPTGPFFFCGMIVCFKGKSQK